VMDRDLVEHLHRRRMHHSLDPDNAHGHPCTTSEVKTVPSRHARRQGRTLGGMPCEAAGAFRCLRAGPTRDIRIRESERGERAGGRRCPVARAGSGAMTHLQRGG
jgi:hypothetical protein